jgi:hypothetical protein
VNPRVLPFVRDLHLYAGLFLSPFVLVFAVSAVVLVHSGRPGAATAETREVAGVAVPAGFENLKGIEQVAVTHEVLGRLGVRGEITALRLVQRNRHFLVTVTVPGRETTVDLDLDRRTAAIAARATGLRDALVFLHRMPGPHNESLRGNSAFMVAWRWLADGTVYLLLFLSASGLYLWTVLRSERRAGLVLLAAGAMSCGGLVYALVG